MTPEHPAGKVNINGVSIVDALRSLGQWKEPKVGDNALPDSYREGDPVPPRMLCLELIRWWEKLPPLKGDYQSLRPIYVRCLGGLARNEPEEYWREEIAEVVHWAEMYDRDNGTDAAASLPGIGIVITEGRNALQAAQTDRSKEAQAWR